MNREGIISHLRKDGDKWLIQTNDEHQLGVAKKAKSFAADFGMGGWGYALGMLHDKGKESIGFQNHIRQKSGYDITTRTIGEFHHSYIGAVIARNLYGKDYDKLLSNQILSHHTGLHDMSEIDSAISKSIPEEVDMAVPKYPLEDIRFYNGFEHKDVHHLSRMLFSCLVDADYLDTEGFMYPASSALRGHHATLKELYGRFEDYLRKITENCPKTEVNQIRQLVQQQCLQMSEQEQGFYSLTVPTGGGKTLSSLLWAMRHAIRHNLRRIIIAIPYTSIIVQTADTLKRIFGEENVLEHHSGAEIEDGIISPLQQSIKLATENWDYPIIVTTNVQLFESMFSNKPSACRKLHNIIKSVIILDETQTLPTDFLQPIVDSLRTYQRLFNVSVLFTTASLPILSGEIKGCNPSIKLQGLREVKEIIPESLELYKKLERVQLSIDNSGKTYDDVVKELSRFKRVLCIVNTRRDALEIYKRLPEEGRVHLSRMMYSDHIRTQIDWVKHILKRDSDMPLRVVSTQLIEAGVDIDFPVVFRQEAGLDSILQAAGRCNREGKLPCCTTFVFSLSREYNLPTGHIKDANAARLALGGRDDWFSPLAMTDYFRQLYSRSETFDCKKMTDYLYNEEDMLFSTAAKEFKLIEDNQVSIIIRVNKSEGLIDQLTCGDCSYGLMKKLLRFSVCVPRPYLHILLKGNAIEEISDGLYITKDEKQYDMNIGLRLEVEK